MHVEGIERGRSIEYRRLYGRTSQTMNHIPECREWGEGSRMEPGTESNAYLFILLILI